MAQNSIITWQDNTQGTQLLVSRLTCDPGKTLNQVAHPSRSREGQALYCQAWCDSWMLSERALASDLLAELSALPWWPLWALPGLCFAEHEGHPCLSLAENNPCLSWLSSSSLPLHHPPALPGLQQMLVTYSPRYANVSSTFTWSIFFLKKRSDLT